MRRTRERPVIVLDYRKDYSMWECEACGHIFSSASASSGPEPECEPGVTCPNCGAFVPDDSVPEED